MHFALKSTQLSVQELKSNIFIREDSISVLVLHPLASFPVYGNASANFLKIYTCNRDRKLFLMMSDVSHFCANSEEENILIVSPFIRRGHSGSPHSDFYSGRCSWHNPTWDLGERKCQTCSLLGRPPLLYHYHYTKHQQQQHSFYIILRLTTAITKKNNKGLQILLVM